MSAARVPCLLVSTEGTWRRWRLAVKGSTRAGSAGPDPPSAGCGRRVKEVPGAQRRSGSHGLGESGGVPEKAALKQRPGGRGGFGQEDGWEEETGMCKGPEAVRNRKKLSAFRAQAREDRDLIPHPSGFPQRKDTRFRFKGAARQVSVYD